MKPKLFYKMGRNVVVLFSIILSIECQKSEAEVKGGIKNKNVIELLSQEEKDWQKVKDALVMFCDTPEECEKYDNSNFWEARIFEEKVHRNNRNLIKNFLNKYPQSNHYFEALKYYFSYIVEPRFINSTVNKDKEAILSMGFVDSKSNTNHLYRKFRILPYNLELKERWLQEGDSLVQEFIKTNASSDQKVSIEIANLARDKRMARYLYEFLNPNKKEEEAEYWSLFDAYFWRNFIERMEQLIFKYPDYSEWPHNIDLFIKGITLDFLSPEMKETLWEYFREITDRPELFKEHPVIAQIHQKAEENLKAIVALKDFDGSQPLQMEFIDMDGKKVDLKDYRGKVVLLDFWSIRCAPCIREMPHVRALYDKYKAQGFEVIGISAESDAAKEQVLEITQKQGANWPQLLDKGTDVTVSYHSLYRIETLPTVWLLNKDGIIVDKYARGKRLEPLIRKYLELD